VASAPETLSVAPGSGWLPVTITTGKPGRVRFAITFDGLRAILDTVVGAEAGPSAPSGLAARAGVVVLANDEDIPDDEARFRPGIVTFEVKK
jgi:hypothetical protein